jgi:hypothetical protein
VFAKALDIARRPAGVDPHVATVGPAHLLQPLQERRYSGLPFRIVLGQVRVGHQTTDFGALTQRVDAGDPVECC